MQRVHEFRIKFGDGTRDERESPGFAATGLDFQRVGNEIENDFEGSVGVGNLRRGETASVYIESGCAKMVDRGAKGQSDLAHDLGPHVQSGVGVLPLRKRKSRPGVRLSHRKLLAFRTA